MSIPLNGKTLGYRFGTTDRTLGDPAAGPEGFLVYNSTNATAFQISGGVWATATMDADLFQAWHAETPTNAGIGYRIGNTDRTIGASTNNAPGFFVLNTTNDKCFTPSGGVWADGGTFPAALLTAWLDA
jgi:hypothetical protein